MATTTTMYKHILLFLLLTAVSFDLTAAQVQRWSDPSTWPDRKVPSPGSVAVIPRGKTVVLDTSVKLLGILVDGVLKCPGGDSGIPAVRNLAIETDYLVARQGGKFQCGTATSPIPRSMKVEIVLTARSSSGSIAGMGIKVLGTLGGVIEIHGSPRRPWARIASTARAGSRAITMDSDVDWTVGDRIAIASTDFDMEQAEERTIVRVAGRQITFDKPLVFEHFGASQEITTPKRRRFVLRMYAEVALLTRNIVVMGDATSNATGFGGHIMANGEGSEMRLSNVEITQMGQKAKLARYPVHFHQQGNRAVAGQYVKDCAVHHTHNRCITIHRANGIRVENNVCYDNLGHAFFLEDGIERKNVLKSNLGFVTRRPRPSEAVRPSDVTARGGDLMGPATFWIGHADNIVQNNVAAGSAGSGFWYGSHDKPLNFNPATDGSTPPNEETVTLFDGNLMHSMGGFAMIVGATKVDGPVSLYRPVVKARFTNSVVYKTRSRGVWTHGTNMHLDNFIMADNVRGSFFSFDTELSNSLIIGESINRGNPRTPAERALGRSTATRAGLVTGYIVYDGNVLLRNVHFSGFGRDSPNVFLFANNGGAMQRMGNQFVGVTWDADTKHVFQTGVKFKSSNFHQAIIDVDGALSGRRGSTILPNLPINVDKKGSCARFSNSADGGWVSCANIKFALIQLFTPQIVKNRLLPDALWTRSDGERHEVRNQGSGDFYNIGAILDQGFVYTFHLPANAANTRIQVRVKDAIRGRSVVFELKGLAAGRVPERAPGSPVFLAVNSLAELHRSGPNTFFRSGDSLFMKVTDSTFELTRGRA